MCLRSTTSRMHQWEHQYIYIYIQYVHIHIYQRIYMYTVQLQRILCPRLGLSEPIASSSRRQRTLRLWRRPCPTNCRFSPPHRPRLLGGNVRSRRRRRTFPSCSIPHLPVRACARPSYLRSWFSHNMLDRRQDPHP